MKLVHASLQPKACELHLNHLAQILIQLLASAIEGQIDAVKTSVSTRKHGCVHRNAINSEQTHVSIVALQARKPLHRDTRAPGHKLQQPRSLLVCKSFNGGPKPFRQDAPRPATCTHGRTACCVSSQRHRWSEGRTPEALVPGSRTR